MVLWLTHFFAGLLAYRQTPAGENMWYAMFPPPGHPLESSLPYNVDYAMLGWYGDISAFLLAFWNYLLISLLGAFAISFYFSVNTIIYYLMRREVDATEMDDVYLEQPEEDFVETPVAAPAESSAPAPAAAGSGTEASTTAPSATAESGGAATYTAPAEQTPDTPPGT
jgi:hypothetical protein